MDERIKAHSYFLHITPNKLFSKHLRISNFIASIVESHRAIWHFPVNTKWWMDISIHQQVWEFVLVVLYLYLNVVPLISFLLIVWFDYDSDYVSKWVLLFGIICFECNPLIIDREDQIKGYNYLTMLIFPSWL